MACRYRQRVGLEEVDKDNKQESIKGYDAKMFPVYASCSLLGLYLLLKNINPDYLNILIKCYISLAGIPVIMFMIASFLP